MAAIILSGAGGSSNWLPLIFPLVAFLAIVYAVDFAVKLIRKRKLHRENKLVNDVISSFDQDKGV